MRRFFFIPVLTFVMISYAAAGDYVLVDEFRVPPPAGAIAADPIVKDDGVLTGFIYILPDSQSVVIDRATKAPSLATSTGGIVVKTINSYVGDTLFVYSLVCPTTLGGTAAAHPKISLLIAYDGTPTVRAVTPVYNTPNTDWLALQSVTDADICFSRPMNGSGKAVILSCREMYFDYVVTQGPLWEAASTSIVFNLDLNSELYRDGSSYLVRGDFTDGAKPDLCGFTDAYYSWDFRDSYDDPNYGTSASITVSAFKNSGDLLAQQKSADGHDLELFTGDFIRDGDHRDELISSGYARDLLGLHGTTAKGHMACYNFSNGAPQEVWYRALSPKLDFYFAWGGFITEIRDNIQVAHLNVATGQFVETQTLPTLGYTRFFTTGPFNDALNLLSLKDDTVRIYRYDAPTPVDEPSTDPSLPDAFSLSQNYPNPFNGETVVRFELTRPANISIKVYNVRGQQVALLADGSFTSGAHQITWKPGVDVASGVYFVTLKSTAGSRTIQAQYVK